MVCTPNITPLFLSRYPQNQNKYVGGRRLSFNQEFSGFYEFFEVNFFVAKGIKKISMCLSIPCKVLSIEGDKAIVSAGGTEYEASLQLVEDVRVDDYVLIHTGFAIQKISEEEARETMKLLMELAEIDREIREREDEVSG